MLELAVVAELARRTRSAPRWRRRARRPRRSRPSWSRRASRRRRRRSRPGRRAVPVGAVGVGAVLEQEDPVVAAVGGDPLGVEGDVAADVDEDRGPRLVPLGLGARSPRRTCRGRSRLQSTNSTSAPAPIAASGVAMKVLEGQSTVSPRTPANSSAARAPPAQLERPRLGRPFHSAQRCSKASSLAPSDHCSESSTSVQSSNRRARSRWSNPIANLVASGRVVSAGPTMAPW